MLALLLPSGSRSSAQKPEEFKGSFQVITRFSGFQVTTQAGSKVILWTSPPMRSAKPWNELVLSWNARTPGASGCEFRSRAKTSGHWTPYYSLGRWAEQTNAFLRQSVAGQKDADGEVLTDVLRLSQAAQEFQVRAELTPDNDGTTPTLRALGVSLINTAEASTPRPADSSVWGGRLEVPQSSQHAHPEGKAWCSPTSLSMVLRYWSARLRAPELDQEAPATARAVFDPVWGGTGNWPFNTAYAGEFESLFAFVVRLRDLRDVEDLIARKIPVILSVDLNALRERTRKQIEGHLVVAVGFTAKGDVWVNDPDTPHPPIPGRTVLRVYPREAVERAWTASHRTIYLVQPSTEPMPSLPADSAQ
ncbi:MAG: peptidase C39 family protein [Verrucomicrobia bacterium]|nr:peptidase C39 family protein [Verrucomicrobiota bacterium]